MGKFYSNSLTENVVYANSFNGDSAEVADIEFSDSLNTSTPGVGTITGNNDRMYATGLGSTLGNGGFTISLDLKAFSSNQWGNVICLVSNNDTSTDGSNHTVQVQVNNAQSIHTYVSNNFEGGSGAPTYDPNNTFWNPTGNTASGTASTWTDLGDATITLVYDPTVQKVYSYLNGELKSTATLSNATSDAITGIYFGRAPSQHACSSATFDNISIWKTALTAEQIGNTLIHKTWTEGESYSWADVSADDTWSVLNVKVAAAADATPGTATVNIADNKTVSITDLSVTGGSLTMKVADGSSLTIGNTHMATGASLALSGVGTISLTGEIDTLAAPLSIAIGTMVSLGESAILKIGESTLNNQGTLSLALGSTIQLSADVGTFNVGNITIAGGGSFADNVVDYVNYKRGLIYEYNGTAITVSGSAGGALSLTWSGTEENNTWSTQSGDNNWTHDSRSDFFADGDTVSFGAGDGINKTVAVSGEVHAADVNVNAEYTFSGGSLHADDLKLASSLTLADGHNLMADVISVAANGTASITTTGEGTSLNATAVSLGSGSTLDLTGSDGANLGSLSVAESSILKLGANSSVQIDMGTGNTTAPAANASITTGEGTAVSVSGTFSSTAPAACAALTGYVGMVKGDGKLVFTEFADMQPGSGNQEWSLTVGGAEGSAKQNVEFLQGLRFAGGKASDANNGNGNQYKQTLTIAESGTLTVKNAALQLQRMQAVVAGGNLVAETGILVGHATPGCFEGRLVMTSGSITTSIIQSQNTQGGNDRSLDNSNSYIQSGGTLTITGNAIFGLTGNDKRLWVSITGGTITTTATSTNLLGNTSTNLKVDMGGWTSTSTRTRRWCSTGPSTKPAPLPRRVQVFWNLPPHLPLPMVRRLITMCRLVL